MITLKKIETKNEEKKALKLYKTAFPKEEQKPWKLLLKKQKEGLYNLSIAVDEENNFYGLAFTIKNNNVILLDFLAIQPEFRGQGIGSKILKLLQENKNKEEKIVIEIEDTTSTTTMNLLERIKRKDFYIKNNMIDNKYKISLFNCPFEILSFGENVSFEEYFKVLELLYGNKKASKYVKFLG